MEDKLFVPTATFDDELAPDQDERLIKSEEAIRGQDYQRLTNDHIIDKLTSNKDDEKQSEEQRSLMKAEEMERNVLV